MPNCDFYGTTADHERVLTWLFAERTCHVFELYSDFGQPLRQFTSPLEVLTQFERTHPNGTKWTNVHLQLYVIGAGPPFAPRLVRLDPKHCDGATFRYAAEGWGLVQLYLGTVSPKGLCDSHTNHNSEKRAATWSPTIPELGSVDAWNFKGVTAFSSRLNREIRKMGIAKLGSRTVLPGALQLWNAGLSLLPFNPNNSAIVLNEA